MELGLGQPSEQPGEVIGYPRPFSFREINPKNLPYLDEMAMVVSDLHLRTRKGEIPEEPIFRADPAADRGGAGG